MEYKQICNAILQTSRKDKRSLIRRLITLFEAIQIPNWNRDEFLECLIKCREEMKGGDENADK